MSLLLTGASLLVQSLDRTLSLRLSPWFIVSLINPYLDAYGAAFMLPLHTVRGSACRGSLYAARWLDTIASPETYVCRGLFY
jgi:hypothetical protein